jgi:kynurenine formamidase
VLINTGWGILWGRDNAQYVRGCPGIGIPAAEWLIRQEPVLLGSDNWPVEVAPNPDRNASLPVHQIALVVHGVHLLENMKLDELAERRLYEFAFMMQPLKIAGGTGSTVAPSALVVARQPSTSMPRSPASSTARRSRSASATQPSVGA